MEKPAKYEDEDDPELIARWERAMVQRYAPLEKNEKQFVFCPKCRERLEAKFDLVNAHFIGKHFSAMYYGCKGESL